MSQGFRILAVDDDPTVLKLYQDAFEARGQMPIAVAVNPEQAYAILDENPIEALLLDLDLGPTNGSEILEHCQASYPALRIFVISAHSDRKVGDILIEAGAERVFRKPVSMDYVFGELCIAGVCEDPFGAIRPGQGETLSAEADVPLRHSAGPPRRDHPSPSSVERPSSEGLEPSKKEERRVSPPPANVSSHPKGAPGEEPPSKERFGLLPILLVVLLLAGLAGALWAYHSFM